MDSWFCTIFNFKYTNLFTVIEMKLKRIVLLLNCRFAVFSRGFSNSCRFQGIGNILIIASLSSDSPLSISGLNQSINTQCNLARSLKCFQVCKWRKRERRFRTNNIKGTCSTYAAFSQLELNPIKLRSRTAGWLARHLAASDANW